MQYLTARVAPTDTVLVGDHMVNTQLVLMNVGLAGARRTQSPDVAVAALARGGKVWAIYGRVGQGRMLSRDADLGPPILRVDVGRSILILGFENRASATIAPPGRRHGRRAHHV
ncbi:MAG: hypothetical protein ACREEL_01880 [Stellaceae bacterium]